MESAVIRSDEIGARSPAVATRQSTRWPIERILFALAGTVVLVSAVLAAVISPWFLVLTALVGVNQWMFVAFGMCPASLVLRKLGVPAECRW
jgi:hypothetical protein